MAGIRTVPFPGQQPIAGCRARTLRAAPAARGRQFVHPADLEENLRRWQRCIDTGEPFQLEHRFRRSDGVYRWHLSRANALRDAEGNVLLWTGSSTDIDDQKCSENALKDADKHKNEFLAMLAHELRNPLAALKCGLSLLTGASHESDRDWALTMAEHQVRLLTRMVNDLLDTSRITRGTFQLQRERVRPAELIERAVDTVRHLAQAKGIICTSQWPRTCRYCKPTRLGSSRSLTTS